jgi:hypothetical protein
MRFRDLKLRLRALIAPGRIERDLHDELSFHIECEARRLIDRGMQPDHARPVSLRCVLSGRNERSTASCARDARRSGGVMAAPARVFRRAARPADPVAFH